MGARDWEDCDLGDVLTLKRGYDLPKKDRTPGPYPIVSSGGISGSHIQAKVKRPGVVTGRYGTLGEVFFIESDFWPLNTSLYVKDFKGNDPRFISYFMKTLNFGNQNVAGAVPGVNRNYLHMLPVRKPPVQVQQRIAAILSAYDDMIENNTRRIAILEEMARRLYEEWFVHFRFPGHEGVKMVESEIGPVPEGWEVRSVEDVAIIVRGRSYKGVELVEEGGLPFINLKCIDREGGFRRNGLKRYIGKFKLEQVVQAGDIVMAVTDMTQERRIVARCAVVPTLEDAHGVISMDMVKIVSREGVQRLYLYAMLRWSRFAAEVKQHATGVNVLHLHPDRISNFKFALSSEALRTRFSEVALVFLDLCETLETKNTNLRAQRDLLLPKLISGEIDVSEFPEQPAEAAE